MFRGVGGKYATRYTGIDRELALSLTAPTHKIKLHILSCDPARRQPPTALSVETIVMNSPSPEVPNFRLFGFPHLEGLLNAGYMFSFCAGGLLGRGGLIRLASLA